jgi:chemotaxis protein CheX
MSPEPQLTLDETLAAEISNAVVTTMKNMFDVTAQPKRCEIGRGIVSLVGDVSGVIGMVQDELEGTLTLSFNNEMMCNLLPKVIGQSVTITHEMAVDAVGEVTNMIFGQLKTDLNRRGYGMKLGIPSVVTGKGHFLSHFHRGPYLIMPFLINEHLFQVHVAMHKPNAGEASV